MTKTRGMVAMTTGRKDNIAEERMLAILPVCYFVFGCYLFVVSHMLANGGGTMTIEEDGGGDDRTRGQHRRRKYVGYTTCLLFFFGCYLFVFFHMLANGGGTTTIEEDAGDDRTRGQTTLPKKVR